MSMVKFAFHEIRTLVVLRKPGASNALQDSRKAQPWRDVISSLSTPAWAVKYDFQLICQSEDAKMRFHPKGGIEHRQYLRLKNVVASVRGFPRRGTPSLGGKSGNVKLCRGYAVGSKTPTMIRPKS